MNVREVLTNLGYKDLYEDGKSFRTKPLYRESDSDGVLCVYKDTGFFVDFSRQIKGPIEELVRLSLNLSSRADAKEWLNGKFTPTKTVTVNHNEKIICNNIYENNNLEKIIPNHNYWTNKYIEENTIKLFEGGVDNGVERGRMRGRYVFPIFNSRKDIVGFSGRYLNEIPKNSKIFKWKHLGSVSDWVYPAFFNKKILKEKKEVILVEGIGDMISLWNAGITNVLVTFGLNIQAGLLSYLIKIYSKKITIALDGDERGKEGALKIRLALLDYFDKEKISITHPLDGKDFGDMTKEEIQNWGQNIE